MEEDDKGALSVCHIYGRIEGRPITKNIGLIAQREKGAHFSEDIVLIKNCCLNNGKHRSRRVRAHKRMYNKIARAKFKADLLKTEYSEAV